MKRKSRRAFAFLGLLLVPFALGAAVVLIKSALTSDPNAQRTSRLAFGHGPIFKAAAGNSSTDAARVKHHVASARKTDSSVESPASANANTNSLCPDTDETWTATLGIGVDLDKQCDYAVVWGTELKGGSVGNAGGHDSHAQGDSSPQSTHGDTLAFGGWQGPLIAGGTSTTGAPAHARSHDPASASGYLQQIADSCAEGTCKTSSATDGRPGQGTSDRPGKTTTPAATTPTPTVNVPEPSMFALLLIGACGLLLGRRLS